MEELKQYKTSDVVLFVAMLSIPSALVFAGFIYLMAFLLGI
jgi:hypothetical protein